ncbi:cytochrome c biogenesis protein ResB [Desulfurobacterium atlanticum]|uniref:Cytochrome c biogenesis protein n=1 Tax=Desulfurobacterium atlanticum TaxID=240169 RepID=A0A238XKV6_9BACT|nr:cytochrome c biogenesis protein ResB [Desulfurobacterium atlanticum]SNR58609.1 cytochrome c biogenesis protein [Desulfurobacterium atlanticum]
MLKKLYNLFSSVKLAIVILISLAVTSIIGTIIEQQQDPDKYLREYGEVTYKIFKFLGFTDVYHSWWYILLLVLLGLNLIICSIERLPYIWKLAKYPKKKLAEGAESSFKLVHKITLSVPDKEAVVGKIKEALSKLGYKTEVVEDEKEKNIKYLFADKNVFARFGVYIVHAGIIIVLIGGLLTALFGYRGYMNLAQGGKSNLVTLFGNGHIIELPFEVECKKFTMEFYPSGMPKSYISDLVILKDGKAVKEQIIEVNTPLSYEGIYFYQASYGQGRVFFFHKENQNAKEKQLIVAFGQPFYVGKGKDGKKYFLSPVAAQGGIIFVDLLTKDGKRIAQAQMMPNNWYRIPQTDQFVAIAGADNKFYTGLQVSYDPGTWVVWTGSTILTIGLFIAFFISHKRILVRVKDVKDGKVNIVIAGRTNKGNESLEKDMEKVLGVLKSSYCNIQAPKEEKDV